MKTANKKSPESLNHIKNVTYYFIIFYSVIAFIINPIFFKYMISENKQLSENIFNLLLVGFFIITLSIILLLYCLLLIRKGIITTPTIINNINISVFIIVLMLFVFELFFRFVIKPQEPLELYSYNKYLDYGYMKPNQYIQIVTDEYSCVLTTNNIGLRGADNFTATKQDDEIRIMNIGDSFIQAAQVNLEQTMTYLFENKLNSFNSKQNYTVYNIGISGFGISEYREFIQRNIELFKPDYILLFLYVGNDIITLSNIPEINPPPTIVKSYLESIVLNISRVSKLINYFNVRLRTPEPEWMGPIGRPIQPFDILPENISANVFLKNYNLYIVNAFKKAFEELSIIQKHCLNNRIKFFVFIVPTKEQVVDNKFEEVIEKLGYGADQFDLSKPQKVLKIFFDENNIQYSDLLDTLKKASEYHNIYYEIDSHWNDYGNYIVSEKVFDCFINKIQPL
jgi:hypothetical protein